MTLLNYTTTVAVARTLAEVQEILVKAGANSVMASYDAGRPTGVAFAVQTSYGLRQFALPVPGPERVLKLLVDDPGWKRARKGAPTAEHAERVAWRILKDWVEAQMALISIDAVSLDQVMLPYMTNDAGVSVYELYVNQQLALGPGEATP